MGKPWTPSYDWGLLEYVKYPQILRLWSLESNTVNLWKGLNSSLVCLLWHRDMINTSPCTCSQSSVNQRHREMFKRSWNLPKVPQTIKKANSISMPWPEAKKDSLEKGLVRWLRWKVNLRAILLAQMPSPRPRTSRQVRKCSLTIRLLLISLSA